MSNPPGRANALLRAGGRAGGRGTRSAYARSYVVKTTASYTGDTYTVHTPPCASHIMDIKNLADPGSRQSLSKHRAFGGIWRAGVAPDLLTPAAMWLKPQRHTRGHTYTVHTPPCASHIMDIKNLADPGSRQSLSKHRAFGGIWRAGVAPDLLTPAAMWLKPQRHTRGTHTRCTHHPARCTGIPFRDPPPLLAAHNKLTTHHPPATHHPVPAVVQPILHQARHEQSAPPQAR